MNAPKAPTPPGLGRQGGGLPGDLPYYGQVTGPSTLPNSSARDVATNGWFTPMAEGWDPMTDAKRWRPPLATDVSLRPSAEVAAGRVELQRLVAIYKKVLNRDGESYASAEQHGKVYHVESYLTDRDIFFGSTQAYVRYLEVARSELDADNGSLRNRLEPQLPVRRENTDWKEGQDCFYAWVRRAFEKKLGATDKIVGIIRVGSSAALRAALKQVRSDYTQKFGVEEANARPIKSQGGYKLGTLSDHALGDAVDIESANNPQISPSNWDAILAYTGKSLNTATRESLWKLDPQKLHGNIQEINDEFVKLLKAEIDAKVAAGVEEKDALASVIKDDKHLTTIGAAFIKRYRAGFFTLPWALVKELHEEKLVWGAVFKEVDLHHFEVP
jgi:hypothetical protein